MLQGDTIPVFWGLARLLLFPYDTTINVGEGRVAIVDGRDRSWVLIDDDRNLVTQGGPRRLWDQIEELYELLESCGRPQRERFGLTVRPDGSQYVWLDSDSELTWELP